MKKHKITGERLKALRKAKGLTQVNMANILNIKEVTYQRYEMGDNLPRLEHLIFLADFFDVSIDYILNYKDEPNPINKNNESILETNNFIKAIYEESKNLDETDKEFIINIVYSLKKHNYLKNTKRIDKKDN